MPIALTCELPPGKRENRQLCTDYDRTDESSIWRWKQEFVRLRTVISLIGKQQQFAILPSLRATPRMTAESPTEQVKARQKGTHMLDVPSLWVPVRHSCSSILKIAMDGMTAIFAWCSYIGPTAIFSEQMYWEDGNSSCFSKQLFALKNMGAWLLELSD